MSLIPQACKATSSHYKANWSILIRICPKLKTPKRDAWLANYLRFFLPKDISYVFDCFHSHLEFLGFYVRKSTGLPLPPVTFKQDEEHSNLKMQDIYSTHFFFLLQFSVLYVGMPVLIGQLSEQIYEPWKNIMFSHIL